MTSLLPLPPARLRGARALAAAALVASGATAQRQPFHGHPDPIGTVVDESGNPLAGARVALEFAPGPGVDPVHELLFARQPPPVVQSQDDGSFVLPLPAVLRQLGMDPRQSVQLLVEKDGWIAWREPIAAGLHSWLGSRAVLRKPRAEEHVVLRFPGARAGALFLVRGLGRSAAARAVEVPAGGRLALLLPLVPNPPAFVERGAEDLVELGWEGQLLDPGASSKPLPIPRGEATWPQQPAGGTGEHALAAGGGATRGLYRCADGVLRWFPLRGAAAFEDAACRLVLVHGEGRVASSAFGDPLPAAPQRPTRLVVQETPDVPLRDALVELHRLEDWTPDRTLPPPRRPLHGGRTDERGAFELPPAAGWLYVAAPGHRPALMLEPRAAGAGLTVALPRAPHGSLVLELVRDDGRPPDAAIVRLPPHAQAMLANPGPPARADGDGRLRLDGLPAGELAFTVCADGCVVRQAKATITPDGATELRVELPRAAEARLLTVDAQDRPLPFLRVPVHAGNETHPHGSDSLGRLWVRQLPPAETSFAVPAFGGDRIDLQAGAVQSLVCQDTPAVLLLLPPDVRAFRTTWITGDGGSSTRSQRPPAGSPLLRWNAQPNGELWVGLGAGPPVRVAGGDVFDAPRRDPVVVVDRRAIVRRVPLRVTDADGRPVTGYRVAPRSPHHNGGMLSPADGDMALADGAGTWFVARDRGAWDCVVVHPAFVLDDVTAPEGDDAPLTVTLTRGSPVRFQLTAGGEGATVTLMVHGAEGGRLYMIQDLPLPAASDGRVTLQCPIALPNGKWRVDVHGRKERPAARFEVDGATEVVVDVPDKTAAK
jgi:hypothetical protein